MVVLRNQIGRKLLFQFFLDQMDFVIILWLVPTELDMPLQELRPVFSHLVKIRQTAQYYTFFFDFMIQMMLVLFQVYQILWFLAIWKDMLYADIFFTIKGTYVVVNAYGISNTTTYLDLLKALSK